MSKLTKEARDALPDEAFAVRRTRQLPLHDADHVKWAWGSASQLKGITLDERKDARALILAAAEKFHVDFTDWQAVLPSMSMESVSAMSVEVPTEPHPNKMPFSGILTRIDEPSDAAPSGSGGRRVMITREAAERALGSLLCMAVDYQPDFAGHDPKAKVGVISDATIEGNAICIKGFIYAADFPEIAELIKANKHVLGMSFEARDLVTNNPKGDPLPIVELQFTGAAILLKDKAAYTSTSINAARDAANGELKMDEAVQKSFNDIAATLKQIGDAVTAQGAEIVELKKAHVEAANLLNKVEPHAKKLEDIADKFDGDGIGSDPVRGHAATLRDMAANMRADAAVGKMPHIYSPRGLWSQADKVEANADALKAMSEKLTAEFNAKIAQIEATHKDALAAAETKIADLKAKQTATPATNGAPERKTLTPGTLALLAKAGLDGEIDANGKMNPAKLDKALAELGWEPERRIELKTALARENVIA